MSNLQLRTISAIVLAAAVLLLTWLGGLPFRMLTAAIALAIFYEWSRMSRPNSETGWAGGNLNMLPEVFILMFAGALVAGIPALALIILTAVFTFILWGLGKLRRAGAWEAAGFGYSALSGLSLALLRGGDTRPASLAILFLFAVVWATDVFAYFVGRARSAGPKLAPAISPGKTRSGAARRRSSPVSLTGLLVSPGSAASPRNMFLLVRDRPHCCRSISQAGDLFESWVKRRHGLQGFGLADHPGPRRRHGPRRRPRRRGLRPIPHRLAVRFGADRPAQGIVSGLRCDWGSCGEAPHSPRFAAIPP
jgi:phosphatidate cytidylyltransferase